MRKNIWETTSPTIPSCVQKRFLQLPTRQPSGTRGHVSSAGIAILLLLGLHPSLGRGHLECRSGRTPPSSIFRGGVWGRRSKTKEPAGCIMHLDDVRPDQMRIAWVHLTRRRTPAGCRGCCRRQAKKERHYQNHVACGWRIDGWSDGGGGVASSRLSGPDLFPWQRGKEGPTPLLLRPVARHHFCALSGTIVVVLFFGVRSSGRRESAA